MIKSMIKVPTSDQIAVADEICIHQDKVQAHTDEMLSNNCEQTRSVEAWWVKLEQAGESVNWFLLKTSPLGDFYLLWFLFLNKSD